MAYTPTNWADGDVVNATKLNKIEQGIANAGSLVLHVNETTSGGDTIYTLDKTWQEIYDAFMSGVNVGVIQSVDNNDYTGYYWQGVESVSAGENYHSVYLSEEFYADSANGYPSYTASEPV